jgi:hypothetical protein
LIAFVCQRVRAWGGTTVGEVVDFIEGEKFYFHFSDLNSQEVCHKVLVIEYD